MTNPLLYADFGELEIYDVSHLLPTHPSKHYRARPAPFSEVYVHHSGRLGAAGLEGYINSARYVVRHRGWPGTPYHLWVPHAPRANDKLVVYLGQKFWVRTYHAGTGPNDRAIAICLQGNTTRLEPPQDQLRALGLLLRMFAGHQIYGHCEAPADGHAKAACPGSHAKAFLEGARANKGLA